jgi:hypothetical protein
MKASLGRQDAKTPRKARFSAPPRLSTQWTATLDTEQNSAAGDPETQGSITAIPLTKGTRDSLFAS